nr:immunoglobulin heavy chain junction region [Mus musculus]MBK4195688.1 immunoglobulin heavy chain junction region [Mus musculus]MBK4195689.1 immunoglobulin heavy chain junction region [Mus musculus]MBK4195690.1 immunoglobulin heavy chain junction region [Mus musculus]MBK4195691.1 immunoglobulin heavy chain junction region [Mus musculus]
CARRGYYSYFDYW